MSATASAPQSGKSHRRLVSTIAGRARYLGSLDGVDTNALFRYPRQLAIDVASHLYVADSDNSSIRRIDPTGLVSTIAGATPGVSPPETGVVDGFGTAARFNRPVGVALDSSGTLYVADTFNDTIRTIAPSGLTATLAGTFPTSGVIDGEAADTRFNAPRDVAVDSAGNVYVIGVDSIVRNATPSAQVTTIAGSAVESGATDGPGPAARFNRPMGAGIDRAGNLYVADTVNHTIRKITEAGMVNTVAGSPGQRGSADGIGTAASFNSPYDVAVDIAGNAYVADAGNHTIRKITPDGMVTTFAGNPGQAGSTDGLGSAARFNLPASLALDGNVTIYVADARNALIRKITPAGAVTTLAGSPLGVGTSDGVGSEAAFNSPLGIAVDHEGNVFVADQGNHTIRRITPTETVTTIGGSAGQASSVDGRGNAARFSSPSGVDVDFGGNLYVADNQNNRISKGVQNVSVPTPKITVERVGPSALKMTIAAPEASASQIIVESAEILTESIAWKLEAGVMISSSAAGQFETTVFVPPANRFYRARLTQ